MRTLRGGILLLNLLGATAAAQEQGAALEGLVSDASGARVPGTLVSLRGPAQRRPLEIATDARGRFEFPLLAPGRYELAAALDGFRTALAKLEVAVGRRLRVDLVLQPGNRTETVLVSAPLIDVSRSAAYSTLSGALLHGLPGGRDFTSVLARAASADVESKLAGLSIDGASGGENRFFVDGLDTGSLQKGQPAKRLVTDFVEEIQVRTSGYEAEFGGATGGVVNVVTRTGTSDWRGELGALLSGDFLDSAPRPSVRIDPLDNTRLQRVRDPRQAYTTWEPGLALSGPLLRERLWLFAAYMPELVTLRQTVTFLSNGQTRGFQAKRRTQHASASLATQLGARLHARLAGHWSSFFRDGLLPSPDGSGNPGDRYSDFDLRQPNVSGSGSIAFQAGRGLVVSVHGGHFRYDSHESGSPDVVRHQFDRGNVGMPGVPESLQRAGGFVSVASNSALVRDLQTRTSLAADASWRLGRHALKAGAEWERRGNDVWRGYQKPLVRLYWGEAAATTDGRLVRGSFGYYRAYYARTFGDVSGRQIAFFAQDRLTLGNRLTFNLGLRTEDERIPSYRGDSGIDPEAIAFSFGDKLAPRAGVAWDVRGDGRLKAFASWGLFYDTTKLELSRSAFGGDQLLDHFFTLDSPDWTPIGTDAACPPRCPGTLIEVIDRRIPSNDPRDFRIDPGLRPMRTRELTFGLERQLSAAAAVRLRLVHKNLDYAVEDQGVFVPGLGEKYYITNPGFGIGRFLLGPGLPAQPRARRDYDALELELRRAMASGWALQASYLLSRLRGNYSGLASSDEGGRISPNVNRVFDGLAMSFKADGTPSDGLLGTDRPHRLKAQLVRALGRRTLLGVSGFVQSGTPVSRILDLGGSLPIYYLGRKSDGRTPATSRLDLYLQHEVPLGKLRLQLSLNVINLLDQAGVTEIYARELLSELALTSEDFLHGADVQRLIAEQGSLRDPRFLVAVAFQEPRTARLGLKLLF